MSERNFVNDRAPRWAELRSLVELAQLRGLSSLAGADVRRLGALYRAATTDLAAARTMGLSAATIEHVNRLCAAAHDLVYSGRRGSALVRLARFLAVGFPNLVRRTWRHHAFAAAMLFVPAIASFFIFRADPDVLERALGTTFQERAERSAAMPEGERRYLEEIDNPWKPVMSWGITANNVRVALTAFAAGALFCVGAALVMLQNGVLLGGGFAVFANAGVPDVLANFVAAHGPLELTAFCLAAGAGTRVGLSILVPGRLRRGVAFREAGLDAAKMLVGVAAMLVVAGLLEGFVSPSAAPPVVKWLVGAFTLAFLVVWIGFAGRGREHGSAAHPA